ncbi:S8 family peptidase [Clostridium estertheticum]|uniref:S8 family peptidase n=1 Tax=Clostridium estertheticum TaxID=238834 RepID=UPI001C7CF3E7|nr:S8 family serine peptidase [Clostridium estertheticum]MBX4265672.1 S8 family serine peptidase [Clostridium estertheticum]WLC90990.1 S8 family serine peptidase [Clostridium estertheticum]
MKKICAFLSIIILLLMPGANNPVFAEKILEDNVNLIITYNNDTIDNNVKDLIKNSGGQVVSDIPELGASEIRCSPELIEKIRSYQTVKNVSPNPIIKLQKIKMISFKELNKIDQVKGDLFNQYQWDIKNVTNNGKSFNLQSGNHNVVVGIIDTGVDKDHPDLKGNFLGGKNIVPKNFENDLTETGDPNDVEDKSGHGTHVAGTIAGNGRIMGVAPNIGFKSYRIFNKSNDTTGYILATAIVQAVKDKVNVINLSIGGYVIKGKCILTDSKTKKSYKLNDDAEEYSLYKKAIRYAVKNGVTVVASAGNEALDCSNSQNILNYVNNGVKDQGLTYIGNGIEIPGDIKGVITVSASRKDNTIASYSNYGQGVIDISAPGGEMKNITDPNEVYSMCLSSYRDNSYLFMQGTSMAAPKVSALAALTICKYGNIPPKEVAKKIYKSAEKVNTYNSNNYFGHGLVNAYNLLNK